MTAISSDAPKRPRVRHPERVALTPDAAERVDEWIGQLGERLSGKRLARSDLVNWLVASHPTQLDEKELAALHTEHFDPVKALEWAVKKAKEAQAKGETVDVKAFIDATVNTMKPRAPRKPRRKSQANGDTSQQEAATGGET